MFLAFACLPALPFPRCPLQPTLIALACLFAPCLPSEESSLLSFRSVPDRLQVLLQRASYDAESNSLVKLNHRFEFPRLLDLKFYLTENLGPRTAIIERRCGRLQF